MITQHIKNYNSNVLTWEECLINFNESVLNEENIKHNPLGFFVSHSANKIERLKPILDDLKLTVAHLYFNVSTQKQNFGPHRDVDDVYFWQCQGITRWTIENKDVYILEPGDLITVPKNTLHNVEALTPRVGISMSEK
jgi:mannose-6-phosphate isomerase-like protein (cupin superfamily)